MVVTDAHDKYQPGYPGKADYQPPTGCTVAEFGADGNGVSSAPFWPRRPIQPLASGWCSRSACLGDVMMENSDQAGALGMHVRAPELQLRWSGWRLGRCDREAPWISKAKPSLP